MFKKFTNWLRGALKVRPNQLKGTPGLKDRDTELAAAIINAKKEDAVDAVEALAETALKDKLK